LSDQVDLLFASPALDLFFASHSGFEIIGLFEENESINIVPARKSVNEFVLVLVHFSDQIEGDDDV